MSEVENDITRHGASRAEIVITRHGASRAERNNR
jgi:hypothetical protein